MNYQLVFDATRVHYAVWEEVIPWLVAAAFGLLVICIPKLHKGPPRFCRLFGILLLLVGLGGALTISLATHSQRQRIVSALEQGTYQRVEGVVTGFRPGRTDSHPPEEFDVEGHHFRYAPADQFYGFNTVAGEGGPLRDGVRVRIADVDGVIARLEIAK